MKTRTLKFVAVHRKLSDYSDCSDCVLSRLCMLRTWRCDLERGWYYDYMEEIKE